MENCRQINLSIFKYLMSGHGAVVGFTVSAILGCIMQPCLCNMQRPLKVVEMKILDEKNTIFLIFAPNIDRGYMLELPTEVVVTGAHNLCFRAK